MLLEEETWITSPVAPYFQELVTKINSLDDSLLGEEGHAMKFTAETELKEHLNSQEASYKVTNSLLKFLHTIFELLQFVRLTNLAPYDSALRLIELVKVYNSSSEELILGEQAYHNQTLKSITAQHIGKFFFLFFSSNNSELHFFPVGRSAPVQTPGFLEPEGLHDGASQKIV